MNFTGLPFPFPAPGAFLTPSQHHGQGLGAINPSNGNNLVSSASSHSSESSQSSARNGLETTGPAQNRGDSCSTSNSQQTTWSFEEQFKQVGQASTECPVIKNAYTQAWDLGTKIGSALPSIVKIPNYCFQVIGKNWLTSF